MAKKDITKRVIIGGFTYETGPDGVFKRVIASVPKPAPTTPPTFARLHTTADPVHDPRATTGDQWGQSPTGTGSKNADPRAAALPRWNPPQNIYTRGYNPLILDSLNTDYIYHNKDDLRDLRVRGNMNDKLGYITMAPYHFALTNKVVSKPWGFRFAYNPQALSLTSTLDGTPDYSNYGSAEGDVSVPLTSSSQGSFTIWLNRIQDLRSLAVGNYSNYATVLVPEEIEGLLARGTDYDVDYLYRVTNGIVYFNKSQFSSSYGAAGSADQGLLMGGLVDIAFGGVNGNLRVFGQITGITVNHLLFNKDLVPVLSTVDISFTRYPYTARGKKNIYTPGARVQLATGAVVVEKVTDAAVTP
jgi:hypothetical protein